MKIKYQAIVKPDGNLRIYDKQNFMKEVALLAGKDVYISVEKMQRNRSNNQNCYYWGVVIKLCRAGLIDIGYRVSQEQTHDFLKSNFATKEIVNEDSGEILRSVGSTTEMNTMEFSNFIEYIQQWAAEYLGVVIPSPNEELKINFK